MMALAFRCLNGNIRCLLSNVSALMDLLVPTTRQRVLAILLLQPETSFHFRELARLTGSHAGTLGRELQKLVEAGLLLRGEQGNQVRSRANLACPLFDDLAAIFRKTHGVVPAYHQTAIQCLTLTMAIPAEDVIVLDSLRRQRNITDYQGDPVSDAVLTSCLEEAGKLLKYTERWLRETPPRLLGRHEIGQSPSHGVASALLA